MDNAEQIRQLRFRRGTIKSQLTRVNTFLSNPDNQKNVSQLEFKISRLESYLKEFGTIQTQLEYLDNNEQGERDVVETLLCDTISQAKDLLNAAKSNTQISMSENNTLPNFPSTTALGNVYLPAINLPSFSGDYDSYLTFHDSFDSLVHNNSKLTDVQKLYYLRSCLKGEALKVIQTLEITADNYSIAWKRLKNRYENKRTIINGHVTSLLDLPVVNKESPKLLRQLLDAVEQHMDALKILKIDISSWDIIIINLIYSRLDQTTKREWESSLNSDELPTLTQMIKFLTDKCFMLERLQPQKGNINSITKPVMKFPQKFKTEQSFMSTEGTNSNISCFYCKQPHYIYHCINFKNLSLNEKYAELKKCKLCTNCFRPGHTRNDCKSSHCKICNFKHNTLLHNPNYKQGVDAAENNAPQSSKNQTNVPDSVQTGAEAVKHKEPPQVVNACQSQAMNSFYTHSPSQVLLSTAQIFIYDISGKSHLCTALLDSGSQSSFITQGLFNKLNLISDNVYIPVAGINQSVTNIKHKTKGTIKSRINSFEVDITFLILPKITERLPTIEFKKDQIPYPKNIDLADPEFNKPKTIDILLGANMFYSLLCTGQIKLGKNLPILQETVFGWVFSGNFINSKFESKQMVCNFSTLISNEMLHEDLVNFWEVEEIPQKKFLTPEAQVCENYFQSTTTRDVSGKFIVRLPFSESHIPLGDSRQTALNRYNFLEARLNKNENLKHDYFKFMQEYEQLGHMSLNSSRDNCVEQISYFLPHHPVIKECSTTTKTRVVFDGSAKTTSGISLNDTLLVGATVQDDLFSIVLRLRLHKYVLSADIKMMYRQILVHEKDRCFQQIFWRYNSDHPIKAYTLNTVTYGTACAPFLATRCLLQLANEFENKYPVTSKVIRNSFYVDDLLLSVDTIDEALKIHQELTEILNSAHFPLHKYSSNEKTILDAICKNNEGTDNLIKINNTKELKTLGLVWNSDLDTLQYSVNIKYDKNKLTKRTILSVISQIFDPLGLVGPAIIKGKIIMQRLCQLKLEWDEEVPAELHALWFNFLEQINGLNEINIDRHVLCIQPEIIQLHGFSDSSEIAYGAVIYLRSINNNNEICTKLLCAKSKVAPLKPITLPRLELLAATLLTKLSHKIQQVLNITISQCFYYCDSTIVLSWLVTHPSQLKTFVANRVVQILDLTNINDWHHVRSENNAADIISRGTTAQKLQDLNMWWNGPDFISTETLQLKTYATRPLEDLPDLKPISFSAVTVQEINDTLKIFEKFSSLTRLQRVIAYCFRFKLIALKHRVNNSVDLTVEELNYALLVLIKLAQRHEFSQEIKNFQNSISLNRNSKLLSLNPFLDNQGVLRVGGRLSQSHLQYESRHPIILPYKHPLTRLIITHEHIVNLHASLQSLLYTVRQKYWPINGKMLIKGIIHKCVKCYKAKPKSVKFLMGELPEARVTPCLRPFVKCGIDYAGPICIKEGRLRRAKEVKTYICVFICFSTRAIHLDLVSDLSTDSFLNVLKRFIPRRGKPSDLFSDNASNFVGASNHLSELYKLLSDSNSRICNFLAQDKINWHFIPANSPHMGGLWEAAVKSCKYYLKRILGNASVTFEEMYTLLTQIEACLNSRPLTPLSTDPNDYLPLTPAHFIIGDSLKATPQLVLPETCTRLNRYQRLQQLFQHFWKRWSQEYLNQLQQRTKWKTSPNETFKIGTLVVLKDDKRPPLYWPLGRIVELHRGPDSRVRVVSVKVANGSVYKRSVSKICVLPIDDDSSTN